VSSLARRRPMFVCFLLGAAGCCLFRSMPPRSPEEAVVRMRQAIQRQDEARLRLLCARRPHGVDQATYDRRVGAVVCVLLSLREEWHEGADSISITRTGRAAVATYAHVWFGLQICFTEDNEGWAIDTEGTLVAWRRASLLNGELCPGEFGLPPASSEH